MTIIPHGWTYIPRSLIAETLATPITVGRRCLEPLKAFAGDRKLPMKILEDCAVANDAEVHRHEGDLWHCLEGNVEFIVGGALVDPWLEQLPDGRIDDRELTAKAIANGERQVLAPGDWLWIPPGQPHLHRTEGHARLLIVKVPTMEPIPLKAVPGWKDDVPVSG